MQNIALQTARLGSIRVVNQRNVSPQVSAPSLWDRYSSLSGRPTPYHCIVSCRSFGSVLYVSIYISSAGSFHLIVSLQCRCGRDPLAWGPHDL